MPFGPLASLRAGFARDRLPALLKILLVLRAIMGRNSHRTFVSVLILNLPAYVEPNRLRKLTRRFIKRAAKTYARVTVGHEGRVSLFLHTRRYIAHINPLSFTAPPSPDVTSREGTVNPL